VKSTRWDLRWALLFQMFATAAFMLPPAIVKNVYFVHYGFDAEKNLYRLNLLVLLGMTALTVYAMKRFKDLNWWESLRFLGFKKPKLRPILIGLLSLAPILLFCFYQFLSNQDLFYYGLPAKTVFMAALAVVYEEIYFRGFLFRLLRRGRTFRVAAVLSGLFWATAHLDLFSAGSGFNAVDVTLTILTSFLFSFSLALLFEKSGNALWGCMASHLGFNLLQNVFVDNPDPHFTGNLTQDRLCVFIGLIMTGLITWGLTTRLLPRSPEIPASLRAEMNLPVRENEVSAQWGLPLMAAILLMGWFAGPNLLAQNETGKDAMVENQQRVDVHPEQALAHLRSGIALANNNHYDSAIHEFQKTIELDPKNAQAYAFWGNCLNDEGEYQEAIPMFQKASEIVPEEAVIYLYWGSSLEGLGKYDEALPMLKKAIQLTRSNYVTDSANDEIVKIKSKLP
jgi:tetratricopeptide (TPR) repeat protein